jgi:uncharacterized protein YjiS (DUF1127 family)
MSTGIDNWRRERRFRSIVRELEGLSPKQLQALGIRRADINHLAREAARLPMSRGPMPDYWTPLRVVGLIIAIIAPITATLRLFFGYAP